MVSKQSPSVMSQNIPQAIRKDIPLKNPDFGIFFGVFDRMLRGYHIDESIFSLQFNLTMLQIHSNGVVDFINNSPKMFVCPSAPTVSYCFEDFNFSLKGYLNNMSTFISMSLFMCNNETRNNTCQSIETIKNFLAGKYFIISYMDSNVDLNDYEQPIKAYPQTLFFVLDVDNYKSTDIYYKRVEIFDDDDIFLYDYQLRHTTYMKDYITTDFSQGIQNPSNPVAEYRIFSSENLFQINRSYQKLGQMLAVLSGIYHLLRILGFFLISVRVQYKIKNQIMKFLYDLDLSHIKYNKLKTSVQIQIKKSKTPPKKEKKTFRVFPKKIEQIWINFKKEFHTTISFFFNKNYQEEYFNLIDLRTILNTIHDLQKLKIILLDHQQLKLFDQMQRPKIVFSNNILKKKIADPVMKLFGLMRNSNWLETSKQSIKYHHENIPENIDEKLNFFNSIKNSL